jgi:hypothetical protein
MPYSAITMTMWLTVEDPTASTVELLTLVATAVIALAALGLAIYEGRELRQHNRLSVRPLFTESIRISPAHERMCLLLENHGLGPAIIKEWKLIVDGKSCKELGILRWEQLTAHLDLQELGESISYGHFDPGSILAAGVSEELVGVKSAGYSKEKAERFRRTLARLTIVAVYESMYKESFRFEFEGKKHFPSSVQPVQCRGENSTA